MNWDWYSATVPEPADAVLGAFLKAYDLSSLVETRGLHSYARGAEVRRGDRLFCRAFWGGVNGDSCTHVQASGAESPGVVEVIRSKWPEHRVSRADSREDWSHPKAWRWLSKLALRVAEEFDVRVSNVGDWSRGIGGRTLYLGAQSSRVWLTVYEKGKQLGSDPNWVRLEVRVKPSGVGKEALSSVLPGQLMELTRWTREIARGVGAPELDAVRVRDPYVPSDDARSLNYCVHQYGAVFERKVAELGSWSALGEFLGAEREGHLKRGRQH